MAAESEHQVMPNAPKTPTRTIRVPDELWNAVQDKARENGVTVTSIIISGLRDYLIGQAAKEEPDWDQFN